MDLSNIKIVLVAPTHPGNIGAAARAMKTMGLSQLVLVQPKHFPHQTAIDRAAGADDILQQAVVVPHLPQALSGCHIVFAMSARPRDIELPGMKPDVCARLVSTLASNAQVAIVFGREHAGLTNDELLLANYHVLIPANPDYSSLNLAQAVQVMAYELRQKLLASEVKTSIYVDAMATADELQGLYEHLETIMEAVEFLKPSNPKRLPQRIRKLLSRANLEKTEVKILRGLLTQIDKKIH